MIRQPFRCEVATIIALEARRLLAAHPADFAARQIDFTDFSNTAHLVGNGFGGGAITANSRLRLTDGNNNQARSVWFDTAVPIEKFNADFSFTSDADPVSADGLTFTIQNGPTSALGTEGLNLGYTGIDHSESAAVNFYNVGTFGTQFGFNSNGQTPVTDTDMSPIDLHSGHRFLATVRYDGTTLLFSVSDASDRSKVFHSSTTINLPAALGSSTAIVGFTASTGTHVSTQEITSWDFSGTAKPVVATPAAAQPSSVDGTSTALSILGSDPTGNGNLTYTWSVVKAPPGAAAPTFSVNGTATAKMTNVTFHKSGTYRFRCTIRNADGGTTASDVSVVVNQVGTAMRVDPHKRTVRLGGTIQYTSSVLDQFNDPMRTQPSIIYSLEENPGRSSIDPTSGLFTASLILKGHVLVVATAGEIVGKAGATVG